jgi:hypothetical protein
VVVVLLTERLFVSVCPITKETHHENNVPCPRTHANQISVEKIPNARSKTELPSALVCLVTSKVPTQFADVSKCEIHALIQILAALVPFVIVQKIPFVIALETHEEIHSASVLNLTRKVFANLAHADAIPIVMSRTNTKFAFARKASMVIHM